MATVRSLQVNVRADVSEFQKAMQSAQKTMSKMGEKIGNIGKTFSVAVTAPLALLAKTSIDAANDQLEVEKKLETVLKQRTNATTEQIQAIKDLTAAQQKAGVIGDEVQLAGAQQIATFVNTTESVETLIPAMNNLIAQQKGVNATQTDAINIANMVGKAFTGQVGALSRVGITFDETQAKIIKFGTEEEKATTLSQILTQNVGEMNAALLETDEGQITQVTNALGDMMEEIGKELLPMFKTLVGWLDVIVSWFSGLSDKSKNLTIWIGLIAAAIGPLLVGIGFAIKVVSVLAGIIAAIGAPITVAILAISALAAWIVYLYTTNEDVAKFINESWGKIKTFLKNTWDFLSDKAMAVFNYLKEFWETHGEDITTNMTEIWDNIVIILRWFFNLIKTAAETIFNKLKTFWENHGDDITKFTTSVWDNIVGIVQGAFKIFKGIIALFAGLLSGDWEKMWNGAKDIVTGVWDVIGGVVKAGVNSIITALNMFIGGMNRIKFSVPKWVPELGGKSFGINIPKIPMLAKGGIVNDATLAMIGEAGPEAVIPLDKLDNMSGGINITITGNTFSNRRDIDTIGDQLIKRLRMEGL